jgi:hypothetical protein
MPPEAVRDALQSQPAPPEPANERNMMDFPAIKKLLDDLSRQANEAHGKFIDRAHDDAITVLRQMAKDAQPLLPLLHESADALGRYSVGAAGRHEAERFAHAMMKRELCRACWTEEDLTANRVKVCCVLPWKKVPHVIGEPTAEIIGESDTWAGAIRQAAEALGVTWKLGQKE